MAMNLNSKRTAISRGVTLVLAAVLAGCGGGGTDAPDAKVAPPAVIKAWSEAVRKGECMLTPKVEARLLQDLKVLPHERVLEIGTLGGFSTIWLARGIPEDGTVDTCEYEPAHAEVARRNLEAAGVGHKVTVHVGAALETLPTLTGPYDLFFIDADKANNPHYLEWAVKLSRPGSVIVLDNVVCQGIYHRFCPRSLDQYWRSAWLRRLENEAATS